MAGGKFGTSVVLFFCERVLQKCEYCKIMLSRKEGCGRHKVDHWTECPYSPCCCCCSRTLPTYSPAAALLCFLPLSGTTALSASTRGTTPTCCSACLALRWVGFFFRGAEVFCRAGCARVGRDKQFAGPLHPYLFYCSILRAFVTFARWVIHVVTLSDYGVRPD